MQVFHPLHSMLHAENLGLRNCVGFSQIQSHFNCVQYQLGEIKGLKYIYKIFI